MATVFVLTVIALCVILAIRSMRKGKGSCSSSCSGCAFSADCHKKNRRKHS